MVDTLEITDSRTPLARAIEKARAAESEETKARESVARAEAMATKASEAHEGVLRALELAQQAQEDDMVAAAAAGRPAAVSDDLSKARGQEPGLADAAAATGKALVKLKAVAAAAALETERTKRQVDGAIHAVGAGEVDRLLNEASDLAKALGAKRAALSYVAQNLVDPYGEDRRRIRFFLGQEICPNESDMRRIQDNPSWLEWAAFSEKLREDARTPFPI